MEFNGEHAIEMMKRIFDSQDPTEQIVLIAGAGLQRIPIHRVVLNASSQYFAEQYGPDSQTSKAKECLLVYADAETVTNVVNYCYSGNLQLTESNVENVLKIVSVLRMDLLKRKCNEFLSGQLSAENAATALAMARKYDIEDLGAKAFELICDDLELISSIDISPLSLWLFKELLKSGGIDGKRVIVTRIFEWYECDETARRQYMPELLSSMNMEHLKVKFISDELEPMFRKFDLSELIFEEYKRRAMGLTDIKIKDGNGNCLYIIQDTKLIKYNASKNSFVELKSITFHKHSIRVLHGNKLCEFVPKAKNSNYMSRTIDLETLEVENLPATGCNYVSVSHGKFIYSFRPESRDMYGTCERLDMETNTWEILESVCLFDNLFHRAAILNEFIFVSLLSNRVEMFNSKTCKWMPYSYFGEGFVVLVTLKGSLYGFGLEWVKKFNLIDATWSQVCPWKLNVASATSVGDTVYVSLMGGQFGCIDIDESNNWTFRCLRTFDLPKNLQLFSDSAAE